MVRGGDEPANISAINGIRENGYINALAICRGLSPRVALVERRRVVVARVASAK